MRISIFFKYVLFFIVNIIIIYSTKYVNEYIVNKLMNIIFYALIFGGSVFLSDELRKFVSFKYKITKDKYAYSVKYLTVLFLFIPNWKHIKKEYTTYDTTNIFGGEMLGSYSTEVTYDTEEEALRQIDKHKEERKKELRKFFKRPKKETKTIKYL